MEGINPGEGLAGQHQKSGLVWSPVVNRQHIGKLQLDQFLHGLERLAARSAGPCDRISQDLHPVQGQYESGHTTVTEKGAWKNWDSSVRCWIWM
jgi:hypothetical protein